MNDAEEFSTALFALNAFVKASAVDEIGPLEIERKFDSGQSNPTYLMKAGQRRLVLRKQPYGNLLPKAHDVVREYDIMSSLYETGFSVPRPLLACRSTEVIDTQFFLMNFVEGTVYSDGALPNLSSAERGEIYCAMARTLAELHNLDPSILESANVRSRPDFVGRQISIWHRQYAAALTAPNERIDRLANWLNDNKPEPNSQTIAHGDYRIENLILHHNAVAAVLDWELCGIGEPLCDLAYFCMWYHLPHIVLNGLADLDLVALGIPSEQEFISRYASHRNVAVSSAHHNYFLSFSFYRVAAILQGVYRRALEGNAASSMALERGAIADLCLEKAEMFAARCS